MAHDLTQEERNAITTLKRLAKRWPKTLWLFAGEGLCVMRTNEHGDRVFFQEGGGVDPEYMVADIKIPSDGGGF